MAAAAAAGGRSRAVPFADAAVVQHGKPGELRRGTSPCQRDLCSDPSLHVPFSCQEAFERPAHSKSWCCDVPCCASDSAVLCAVCCVLVLCADPPRLLLMP